MILINKKNNNLVQTRVNWAQFGSMSLFPQFSLKSEKGQGRIYKHTNEIIIKYL